MLAFVEQNIASLVIGAILFVLFFLAVRHIVKKKGCGCSGSCENCPGCGRKVDIKTNK